MKLRLDEYYYILNKDYGQEEIEEYMPDDIADKYLEFCESHNLDEVYDYLKRLYSYIRVIDLEYNTIDLEKAYTRYRAIVEVNNKYYSFNWYYTWNWNFEDQVDANKELTEVFPKEVTTTIYEQK